LIGFLLSRTETAASVSEQREQFMDSYPPGVWLETRAFSAAILDKPDPADVAAFVRTLLGKSDPDDYAATIGEDSHAWGDLTTGGSTDDWMFTIGVEEARKATDEWKSTQTGDTSKNAKILRKSMEKDHTVFAPGEEPHHIVQGTDPRAADARALLDKYHIDLNGAENGIKLTRRIHQTSGLQRGKAIRDVTDRLRKAAEGAKSWEAGRDAIMKELGRIRRDINAGNFPCP
jgi:hypothetical protein